jgi:pimeloyl-ACP methyl ester carboxylesterase
LNERRPVGRRIILLHGLWMPGASMQWFASKLAAAGHVPELFSYHGVTDGPEAAVEQLVARLQQGDVDIVSHSLGGLIALQALVEAPPGSVRRVVCLGSPLRGSGAVAGMLRWPAAAAMFGRSAALLQAGVKGRQNAAEIGVIAGRVPHGLGALFAGFHGEHDGTVAVEETRLPGLTDHVVVDARHSGLLFSAEAVEQTLAFLRDGRFRQP